MPRFVAIILFLLFVDDYGLPYAEHLGSPFAWVHTWFLEPTPIKLRLFDLVMIGVLIASQGRPKRPPTVAPVKSMLHLMWITTVVFYMYGAIRGGDGRAASWQVYLILSTVLVAFTISAVYRAPADYAILARWLILAAIYRAAMCWISYFTWAHHYAGAMGAFLTSHDDTITWIVALLILLVNAMDQRKLMVSLRNAILALFFLGAIQFNSRRLAWVSLAMGAVVMYFLFPEGAAKRRINRTIGMMLPAVLIYVAVGWGRPNPIFFPLRAFSSVSTKEDASTLARNAENLGLIATSNSATMILGTGYGHPYKALTMKYDISGFELWRFVPHNSILGLLAFTGVLGFAGFWMIMPTSVFFLARMARLSPDKAMRSLGIIAGSQIIVCANQLYGDMGIFFDRPMYVLAISYAIALRLPVAAGVWGTPRAKAPQPPQAAQAAAPRA